MVQAGTQEAPPDLLIDNQAVYKRKVCLGGRCIHSEVGLQLSLGLEDELQKLCPARRVRHRRLQLAICASNPQYLMVSAMEMKLQDACLINHFQASWNDQSHILWCMPLGLALCLWGWRCQQHAESQRMQQAVSAPAFAARLQHQSGL